MKRWALEDSSKTEAQQSACQILANPGKSVCAFVCKFVSVSCRLWPLAWVRASADLWQGGERGGTPQLPHLRVLNLPLACTLNIPSCSACLFGKRKKKQKTSVPARCLHALPLFCLFSPPAN